jgi:ABC-type antimicrobial peptide transport system permease subunit
VKAEREKIYVMERRKGLKEKKMTPEMIKCITGMIFCFLLGTALGIPLVVMGVIKRDKYNDPQHQKTISEASLSAYQTAFLLFIIVGSIVLAVSVIGMVFFGLRMKKKS